MEVGLIITTFNRPAYLQKCLDSVRRADLSQIDTVLIVDDCSTDKETIQLINDFRLDGRVNLIVAFSKENKSIKGSLRFGFDLLFNSHEICINLDGDAIVRKDFIGKLLDLKGRFPSNIICGFNTTVQNRNPIISEHEDFFEKKYASGINMVINKEQYDKYILPGLLTPHNWDFEASKLHEADGKAVIVSNPSVIQHIGIEESSMGHISASEPPDVAQDFVYDEPEDHGTRLMVRNGNHGEISHAKLALPKVTLIAVDDNVGGIIKAADISCRFIDFAAVKLLSSMPSEDKRVIAIRSLGSKKEYSQFLLKEIVDYIDTPHFIVIQADGFIINFKSWTDEYFNYDYCGAVWNFRDHNRIGNGGCSIRSRRLHEVLKNDPAIVLKNDHIIVNWAEDHNIGYIYRQYLESTHGIKFAPEHICNKFSFEGWGLKPPDNKYNGAFGFHGFSIDFNDANLPYIPYKLPNRQIQ